MAAGLPVVSTAVGGIPEMISHRQNGFLAEPGDHSGLATALVELQHVPELLESVASSGRDRATELFSQKRMLDGYHRIYEEMLNDC